jgi:hypothetical protein
VKKNTKAVLLAKHRSSRKEPRQEKDEYKIRLAMTAATSLETGFYAIQD